MAHDFKAFPELTNAQMAIYYFQSPHKQITESFRATVVKVHDGDTITVRADFRDFDFPIRFARIDTKELSEGGNEARDWLSPKITDAEVDIIVNPENRVGRYGRLIGEVIFGGMSMNDELIRSGLAVPFSQKNEGKITNIDKELDIKQWF